MPEAGSGRRLTAKGQGTYWGAGHVLYLGFGGGYLVWYISINQTVHLKGVNISYFNKPSFKKNPEVWKYISYAGFCVSKGNKSLYCVCLFL